MTATSPGNVAPAVLGYGVLAVVVVFGLWVILHALHFPPVVNATARLRARRTRRNRRAAEALGLQYVGDDDPDLADLPLTLLSRGTSRSLHQVSYGSYRGRDVHMFRLFYTVPGGRYGNTITARRGAVARIDAAFPHVVIERRHLLMGADKLHGAEEVRLDPAFDEEFRVQTTDPAFTQDLVDANVRRWLLGLDKHWRFEIAGPWVLAYREGHDRKVSGRALLDTLSDLADRIPWILAQQRPAGSAPDPDPLPIGPPPPTEEELRRRRRAGKFVGAVAVLFLALVVAGIVAGVVESVSSSAPPDVSVPPPSFDVPSFAPPSSIPVLSPSPTPTPTLTAGSDHPIVLQGLRPGEQVTVTFLGLAVTPHPTLPPGSPPRPFDVGAKFRIENTGTVPYVDYPANGMLMLTAQGRKIHPSILDSFEPGLGQVRVAPGDQVQGFVTFRVRGGQSPATVLFQPDSGFAPQTGRWDV